MTAPPPSAVPPRKPLPSSPQATAPQNPPPQVLEHHSSAPLTEQVQHVAHNFKRKLKSVIGTSQQPSVRLRRGVPTAAPTTDASMAPPAAASGNAVSSDPTGEADGAPLNRPSTMRRLFTLDKAPADTRPPAEEYDADTVDLLDAMDPEVATLSTLTNLQNSLFVPQLGGMINRQATYNLRETPEENSMMNRIIAKLKEIKSPDGSDQTIDTSAVPLVDLKYARLPANLRLQGWTRQNLEELDDRVRHQLHSRRAKMKRSWNGFRQYVRRPLGLFITIYATLITLFGAAWVFFLIGWISIGNKKEYVVSIVDYILVGLFAIIGDGLAPFRAVDTYHMIYIVHYHRLTWKKRAQLGLPELSDVNDLPDLRKDEAEPQGVDLESLVARRLPRRVAKRLAPRIPNRIARRILASDKTSGDPAYQYTVLNKEQQAKLEFHERKFAKSHTFYKPHETETHYAFPQKFLIAIVILLDFHSMLQISLGACTWSIPSKRRPFALTTVILCFSICCNISGGALIAIGDKRTRKKEVVERLEVEEMTVEQVHKMEEEWVEEADKAGVIDPAAKEHLKQKKEERESKENEEIKKSWKSVPLLPKKLLGKGEDHRQPSLPQKARRSGTDLSQTSSGSSTPPTKNVIMNSGTTLKPVSEEMANPSHYHKGPGLDEEPAVEVEESKGQKALRIFRRADGDRS